MQFSIRSKAILIRALCFIGLSSIGGIAAAEGFPDRPITMVVPFPAGGTNDFLARALAQKLTISLHQSVIVENRVGAGGNTGSTYVAAAKPDGYTLMLTAAGPLSINQFIYPKLGYDPVKDFAPVGIIATVPIMLVSNPKCPFKSLAEMISYARAHPGKLSYGSQGYGTTSNLTMELLKYDEHLNIVHVPYRGSAPAAVDLISGTIDVMFDNSPTTLPYVQARQMRALGVATNSRLPGLESIPTISETVKGFESTAWFGIVAPAHTPPGVIDQLNASVNQAMKSPDMRQKLAVSGVQPSADTPAAFGQFIASESTKWAAVVKAANIKAE
jgi:tripartite-type tricarboxylate transporter receptor subunit TctC